MKNLKMPRKLSILARFSLVLMLFAFLIVFQTNIVQAAEISSDLDIFGSASFADGFYDETYYDFYGTGIYWHSDGGSPLSNLPSQPGNIRKKVGGTVSPSLFNSPSSNPSPNPQEGWLTHTGDGVGATLNATNSGFDTGLAVGVDLLLDMLNSSLDDYLVTVRFDFSNQVNATGNDAYADSEFSVEDSDGEFLFTDLVSDTVYGNQVNDAYPASYGGILTDSYNNTINFFLGAGESETIFGMYTMLGEVYGSGVSTTDFNAFISIESVTNLGGGPDPNAVPIPAALPLFGSGLLALAAIRRRFRG